MARFLSHFYNSNQLMVNASAGWIFETKVSGYLSCNFMYPFPVVYASYVHASFNTVRAKWDNFHASQCRFWNWKICERARLSVDSPRTAFTTCTKKKSIRQWLVTTASEVVRLSNWFIKTRQIALNCIRSTHLSFLLRNTRTYSWMIGGARNHEAKKILIIAKTIKWTIHVVRLE